MGMVKVVRGVFVAIFLFLTSTLGQIYQAGWMLPLVFIRPDLYRTWADWNVGSWEVMCAALMELVLGIKIVLTGDVIPSGEKNLIIMNHRTRLDWMYFWSVLVRQSGVCTEKIVLKQELKHIPGAGWAMQSGGYIFLKRRWEEDKSLLSGMVDYYSALKHQTQILIFPEGTDFTARSKARSDEFARKQNLTTYDYVLHPRTTGFTYLAHRLRAVGHLEAVYDVTVGYPYNFPHSEPEFVLGNVPSEVHFHIKRYPIEDLPQSEDGLRTWCCQRWAEKEEQLKKFAGEKTFIMSKSSEPSSKSSTEQNNNLQQPFLMFLVFLIYWTLLVVVSLYLIYFYSLARWIFLAQVIFIMIMEAQGGFDVFQIKYYLKFFAKKTK